MIKVDAPQKYTALLRGSRPATARLAGAPFWIAILSFDLRYATPVQPIAFGRTGRHPLDRFPNRRSLRPATDRWRHNPHSV
jgi:hypothetical protein